MIFAFKYILLMVNLENGLLDQPRSICSRKDLQWIEFFAGRAQATLAMRAAGYKAAKLDYLYYKGSKKSRKNYYDLLTAGGFASFSCTGIESSRFCVW